MKTAIQLSAKKSVAIQLLALLLTAGAMSASAVTLERGSDRWYVKNSYYQLGFNVSSGYLLDRVKVGSISKQTSFQFAYGYDMQPTNFTGNAAAADDSVSRKGATATVVKETADAIEIKFTWGDDDSTIIETYSFDNTAVVDYSADLSWSKVIGSVAYKAIVNQAYINAETTYFYPESRVVLGIHESGLQGESSILPHWKHLKDTKAYDNWGFGIIAPPTSKWDRFNFATRPRSSGYWGTLGWIDVLGEHLAFEAVPNSRHYDLSFVFAVDEAATHRAAIAKLSDLPAAELSDILPDKVVAKRGTGNGLTTAIINNTEVTKKVKLQVSLASGFNTERQICETELTLSPLEIRPFYTNWTYDAAFEWGVATRVRLLDSETNKELDYRADITSVSDKGFAAAGVSVVNSGNCIQDGAEAAWANTFRNNYIGMVEYYAWSPSTWDPQRKAGQAPAGDSWQPCSDSQLSYCSTINKVFLQTLISEAHSRGTDMYDWITGLINARQGMRNPTKVQYGKDGQMLIYSSRIWNGKRFATAKIAPYTVEDATDWGEQTAESVDMFDWDGCRWDWGWSPAVPNDPLYHNVEGKSSAELEWFDYKGVSCFDKFPDPEQTAYDCYRAWIAAVRKKHPNFVNTANCYPTAEQFADGKKYLAEFLRDGMGLLEYLIGFDGSSTHNTLGSWAKVLTEDSNRIRKVGSHSEVGSISSFSGNSAMTQYARYVCHAAGSKWWGGAGDSRYWTAKRRALPFAMRFSEYFWSTEFLQVEDEAERLGKVSVVNGDNLVWKDFVFERTKDGVRELVLHIVNAGPDEHFYPRRAPSPDIENLEIIFNAGAGESEVECWALTPDDEPKATLLISDPTSGHYILPRLQEAATLVWRAK